MKSNLKQLENRGYVTDDKLTGYNTVNNDELIELLTSDNAVKRTIAAKIIGERKISNSLSLLCESLKREKNYIQRLQSVKQLKNMGQVH